MPGKKRDASQGKAVGESISVAFPFNLLLGGGKVKALELIKNNSVMAAALGVKLIREDAESFTVRVKK